MHISLSQDFPFIRNLFFAYILTVAFFLKFAGRGLYPRSVAFDGVHSRLLLLSSKYDV